MKTPMLVLPVLVAAVVLTLINRCPAQTFTLLHSLAGAPTEGANPYSGLVLSGNRLYGTTYNGGANGVGTIFAVNTDGSGFTNLYSFSSSTGARPVAGLILSGATLYGTAPQGGSANGGALFKINTNGTGYTNFYNFNLNSGVAVPNAGLLLVGDTLYGTAFETSGAVFAVRTNGSGYTNLYVFSPLVNQVNSDGAHPQSELVLSGNMLYGTCSRGGLYSQGTVFAVSTNGDVFTNFHDFASADGANPKSGMVLSAGRLYGLTPAGGSGYGVLFGINTDGSEFSNLHVFGGSDGSFPQGGLVLSGDRLLGTASQGSAQGLGIVFTIKTDGSGYYGFEFSFGATAPYASLVLSSGAAYSTTFVGGTGPGTIFKVSLPPILEISQAGTNAILTWPAEASGYKLQFAPTFTNTFTTITNATSPYTNPTTGAQKFFRLISTSN